MDTETTIIIMQRRKGKAAASSAYRETNCARTSIANQPVIVFSFFDVLLFYRMIAGVGASGLSLASLYPNRYRYYRLSPTVIPRKVRVGVDLRAILPAAHADPYYYRTTVYHMCPRQVESTWMAREPRDVSRDNDSPVRLLLFAQARPGRNTARSIVSQSKPPC